MKKILINLVLLGLFVLGLHSCSSFKAQRVDSRKSDEKAMEITDEWVATDTTIVIEDTIEQLEEHKGFKKYLNRRGGKTPKVFIGEFANNTSEAYFPMDDLNDELLNSISATGDFTLIDAAARKSILKEITYQQDGMVDPATAKRIGKQTGADLMIFGNVHMVPKSRKGKTIKEYSINMRMTNIETGEEVVRTRSKLNKYSKQSSSGW